MRESGFALIHWLAVRGAIMLALALAALGARADVLAQVREHGAVRCAVDATPGFGGVAADGRPIGFDVDFCRAVAAAVFGRADAVEVERINTAHKFKALERREVDIAFGMATWTYARDVAMGVSFVAPTYYDGQGLMTWADSPIRALADMRGMRVCVQAGTTTAANLADLSRSAGLALVLVESSSSDDRLHRFTRRDCEVVSGDRSELAAMRATRTLDPERWRILDEILSREPLGPYVVAGDERWFGVVRWVIQAMQIAELHGVSAARPGGTGSAEDGEVLRLAGRTPGFGAPLGLDDAWARSVIAEVGSYAEVFERNLGAAGVLKLERGHNRLWLHGGLFFPPPLK